MWYQNSYRRHLCDMHIADWNDQFLSKFSPEDYYTNLVEANIQTAMIYLQSHLGYCYYPTKSGHMHHALLGREDLIRKLIHLCRTNGITVVGYYSVIYNNWAYDHHPAWRMVDQQGRSLVDQGERYGLCCPNNLDYRAFVAGQIHEMADYFEFDGIFFDMLFWRHTCYCPACQERWRTEVALSDSLPVSEDLNDPAWLLFLEKQQQWLGEFAALLTSETKKIKPDVSVEMNLSTLTAATETIFSGCTQTVNNACDYAGGDLYGGLTEQSFVCKFYRNITKHQPFEYMTSRCNPDLYTHTVTKSADQLAVTALITSAHHGATLMIDAIDPVGTMNKKVYEQIGKAFGKQMPYEPYLKGDMIEDVAVFYNLLRKENFHGQPFNSHTGAVNTAKALIENHILFGVISNANLDHLQRYKMIFMPYVSTLSHENIQKILHYVQNGGNLYFSGAHQEELMQTLLHATVTGYTASAVTYVAPSKGHEELFDGFSQQYPLPFKYSLPIIEGAEGSAVLATITLPYTNNGEAKFASIHSNPPGVPTKIPAMLVKKHGKGTVIWSAAPLEDEKIENYKRILIHLLHLAVPSKELSLDCRAPKSVELVVFDNREDKAKYVNLVHLSDEDQLPTLSGFEVRLKSPKKPVEVLLTPQGESMDFTYDGKTIAFKTKDLHIFDKYLIQY